MSTVKDYLCVKSAVQMIPEKCIECAAKASYIAKVLYRMAKSDMSLNGNGRLILKDVQDNLGDPSLTADKIISIWRTSYLYDAINESIQEGLLIVEFGGCSHSFAPITPVPSQVFFS